MLLRALPPLTPQPFRTLARLCAALECRPKDLLDYDLDPADLLEAGDED